MVIPLVVGAAARLAAGAAVRGVAGKVVGQQAANSVRGRVASQAVGNYGVNALQRGQQNAPGEHQGLIQRARAHPVKYGSGVAYTLANTDTLADSAMSHTNSLLQSTQFSQGA